jgi:hypothetical protein
MKACDLPRLGLAQEYVLESCAKMVEFEYCADERPIFSPELSFLVSLVYRSNHNELS